MIDNERLRYRAKQLSLSTNINGIDYVVVTLPNTSEALLEVCFFNEYKVSDIARNISDDPHTIIPVSGGRRLTSGPASDQVKVVEINEITDNLRALKLVIKPVGDYSTYSLEIGEMYANFFDPVFSQIDFKFRPGCFNTKCFAEREYYGKAQEEPKIHYLSKDFDTFKHTMISAMEERVPGWKPSSEADLDLVLIELISAAADELSDFQDRVMNEAYISTARKRVSIARHARLMDYHIYQGHQSSTWLSLELHNGVETTLEEYFQVKTPGDSSTSVVYSTREKSPYMTFLVNNLTHYTWDRIYPCLKAGSTSADLKIIDTNSNSESLYIVLRDLILNEKITHLVIQEWIHPGTGENLEETGLKSNRQLLKLIPDEEKTTFIYDPLRDQYCLRVHWEKRDQLQNDYNFTINVNEETIENASLFHGNLVKIYHGELKEAYFNEPNTDKHLAQNEFFYDRTKWGTICRLPDYPLSYIDVYEGKTPTGELPAITTLVVKIGDDEWEEKIDLVHSNDDDNHYIVETDEYGTSKIRFGNGVNGKALPENAVVHCKYQIGIGTDGNLGADNLTIFEKKYSYQIKRCWNPFEVINGRGPESVEEILRNVGEAYKIKQFRAVTVNEKEDDYENRTQELIENISKARSFYRWNGSWRTVQISIDPLDTTEISDALHKKILEHVDTVRLIGDQIFVRPPKYVPLEIHVPICIHSDYWLNDIRPILEDEFSYGYTIDGREAFFNPNNWTFGQSLTKSQLIGRIKTIEGIDHVIDNPNPIDPDNTEIQIIIKRFHDVDYNFDDELVIHKNEIVQVKNDPDQMECGFIYFHLRGGHQ